MKRFFCSMVLIAMGVLVPAAVSFAATYYVSTGDSASDSNAGTLAAPWRTITKGAATAVAGDTVLIKGGYYGHEHVVIANAGSSTKPITLEGYDGLPILDGEDWTDYGIYAYQKSYLRLKNLKVKNYRFGVYLQYHCDYSVLDGVVADSCCNTDYVNSGWDGYGIELSYANYCTIKNCSATDNGGDNIYLFKSSYCTLQNCEAYSTQSGDNQYATDYYIVLCWSSNNTIRDCHAENLTAWGKGDHGFIFKDTPNTTGDHSVNNRVVNCTANNFEECFAFAHQAHDNVVDSCTANNTSKDSGFNTGLMVRDGAYSNTFRNCTVNAGAQVVCVYDGVEDNTSQSQSGNSFVNCAFNGGTIGAFLRNAINTRFKNCTFVDADYLFRFSYNVSGVDANSGTALENCILSGVRNQYEATARIYPWTYNRDYVTTETGHSDMADVSATYTDFWAGFGALTGDGNLSANPLFADSTDADFHLKSAVGRWDGTGWVLDAVHSPCIDAGCDTCYYGSEPAPNGGRINMGRYGNTTEASKGGFTVDPVVRVSMSPDSSGTFVCDGVNDDVEINEALALVDTSAICTTVYLTGPATYNVTATLSIGSDAELTGDSTAVLSLGGSTIFNVIKTTSGASGVKVHGFEIDGNDVGTLGSATAVIVLNGATANCEIYDMDVHDSMSGAVQGTSNPRNTSIHDCRFTNMGYTVVGIGSTSSTSVKNLSVYGNVFQTRKTYGVGIINADSIKIYDNTMYSNGETTVGRCIDIRRYSDLDMNHIEIYGNTISDFYGAGIYFYNSSATAYVSTRAAADIRHNTIINCGSSTAVRAGAIRSNGFNLIIRNNVIDSCRYGAYETCVFSSSSCKETQSDSSFVHVMNNIVSNADSIGIWAKKAVGIGAAYAKENVVLENNCFFNCAANWDADSIFIATDNLPADSVGSVDPLFADAANGDYHLKSESGRWDGSGWVTDAVSSPCIDAGLDSCVYADEPSPNGNRINIGLYGNTAEASKTAVSGPVTYVSMSPDVTGDYVCDGVNDEVQINAALALVSESGGAYTTVYLTGPATYVIDTTLWVGSRTILAADSNVVVKLADGAGWSKRAPMLKVLSGGRDIYIHGFEIDGNDVNNYDTDLELLSARGLGKFYYNAIQVDSLCINVNIHNMYIHENLNDGINITRCDSVFVHDNTLYRTGYDGIALMNVTHARLYNNDVRIRYCVGIRETSSNAVKIYDNTIHGGTVNSTAEGQYGIMLVRREAAWLSDDIEVYRNTVHHTLYSGIQAYYQSGTIGGVADAYAHIHHNRIYAAGISSSGAIGSVSCQSFNLLVENNVIDSSRVSGLIVMSGTDAAAGYVIRARNNIFNNVTFAGATKAVANNRSATEKLYLENNCFYGNATNYSATDSVFASGDVIADPLFADAVNHDYHLQSYAGRWNGTAFVTTDTGYSPCIDAGYVGSDYENEPAPNGHRINIGLYGNTAEASISDPAGVDSDTAIPNVFSLSQNVPNPFNPSTAITYSIGSPCMVTMTVYNIVGQRVATLVNEKQAAGAYTVQWKPEHLASGVFFCRLDAGTFSKTMKLVFMK